MNVRTIVAGGLIGAAIGTAFFEIALSSSEAVAVMQAGHIGGMENVQTKVSPQLVVDRRGSPQLLIDQMQTQPFTLRVVERAGLTPDVAGELAASQYGGRGKLRVRAISDGTLVEFRVRAGSAETALKIANAALSLAAETDAARLTPVHDLISNRIKNLEDEIAKLRMVASVSQAPEQQPTAGVVARLQNVEETLWGLKTALTPPFYQETAILAPAALARPVISFWWIAALLGLLAGGGLGLGLSALTGPQCALPRPR